MAISTKWNWLLRGEYSETWGREESQWKEEKHVGQLCFAHLDRLLPLRLGLFSNTAHPSGVCFRHRGHMLGYHCAASGLEGLLAGGALWQLQVSSCCSHPPWGLYLPPARLTSGTQRTCVLWHHHELGSFASALKADCFKGWKFMYFNLAKSLIGTMFSWNFFFTFVTKKIFWALSGLLCWNFLICCEFAINSQLMQVWNTCK